MILQAPLQNRFCKVTFHLLPHNMTQTLTFSLFFGFFWPSGQLTRQKRSTGQRFDLQELRLQHETKQRALEELKGARRSHAKGFGEKNTTHQAYKDNKGHSLYGRWNKQKGGEGYILIYKLE